MQKVCFAAGLRILFFKPVNDVPDCGIFIFWNSFGITPQNNNNNKSLVVQNGAPPTMPPKTVHPPLCPYAYFFRRIILPTWCKKSIFS